MKLRQTTSTWETRLLIPAFVVLFLGLGVLSVFLLAGESNRSRILAEYEADRIAASLAVSFRAESSVDPSSLDPRIRGFGMYSPRGEPVVRLGSAPAAFDFETARRGFVYDRARGLLTLQRVVGPFGPGGPPGAGGPPGSGFPMMRMHDRGSMGMGGGLYGGAQGAPHGPAGALFLSMDISSYYRSQVLYGAAAIVVPIAVAGIAVLFLSLLSSNIRHRRRAQEQETLARLGESARTLAHEIRNPLSAIRIQTGLLRKKVGSGEAAAQLEAIDEEVERLSLLSRRVGDYLRNPRGEPQRIILSHFLVDLSAKLPTAVMYQAADAAKELAVSMDPDLLRSVVENLVRNASESYPDGDGSREIELSLRREKSVAVITVKDRGKGISAELREKVFDPFFTDKVQGSGVGLSLSRRFVEAANGTITLQARSGGGTEARVTLPAQGPA
ncbi:MAG TPA: ATP-binding protein [Spirochaetia bacterium]|nr:ATP-binding protein [Spirochaetia bacterium]